MANGTSRIIDQIFRVRGQDPLAQSLSTLQPGFEAASDALQRHRLRQPIDKLFPGVAQRNPQIANVPFEEAQAVANLEKTLRAPVSGSVPFSFQGELLDKVRRGELTFDEAARQFRQLRPQTRIDPRTGGLITSTGEGSFAPTTLEGTQRRSSEARTSIDQLTPNEKVELRKSVQDFLSSKTVQELESRLSRADFLRNLIKQNPKGVPGLVRTQITRFAGEVGRLTDQDIERNSGSRAIADRLKRVKASALTGKLSEEDVKDFLRIMEISEKTTKEELGRVLDSHVQGTKVFIPNSNDKFLRQAIGGKLQDKITTPSNFTNISEQRNTVTQNPQIQAIQNRIQQLRQKAAQ